MTKTQSDAMFAAVGLAAESWSAVTWITMQSALHIDMMVYQMVSVDWTNNVAKLQRMNNGQAVQYLITDPSLFESYTFGLDNTGKVLNPDNMTDTNNPMAPFSA